MIYKKLLIYNNKKFKIMNHISVIVSIKLNWTVTIYCPSLYHSLNIWIEDQKGHLLNSIDTSINIYRLVHTEMLIHAKWNKRNCICSKAW